MYYSFTLCQVLKDDLAPQRRVKEARNVPKPERHQRINDKPGSGEIFMLYLVPGTTFRRQNRTEMFG